ncbi:hypothetical protein [Anatilimnocola floriformis]|uniref:hypothetical protein n=1 Tax=Anatilimnocola floriformis TaxID=2948575 RepID=UPI0020C55C8C|nr:hypothetical protein [Anatilimnocola floriformis]
MFSAHLTRRDLLLSAAAATFFVSSGEYGLAQGLKDCEDCGGIGFLPMQNRKPYFHIEGQPAPKAADAVPHRYCPKCQPDKKDADLVEEQVARLKTAQDAHKTWEKEFGSPLVRIETRHITVHTQVPLPECKEVGQGFENYAAHVQNLTGTMELTRSRPENYEMMSLLGQPAYNKFREVMEKLFTPEQRGEQWSSGRSVMAFDHPLIPVFYENQPTLRQRPPAHGVAFIGGRKQLSLQTDGKTPLWLAEGYAEYSEYVALKKNLWHTVYNANPAPVPGDWVSQLRQLAVAKQLRPWSEQMTRDLRSWEAADYLQTFGMVTFLIQAEPKKFLSFTRKLREGASDTQALEEAYSKKLTQLEIDGNKWIASRR